MRKSMVRFSQANAISTDICIIGNGLPGLILYAALRADPRTKHINVHIMDRNAFPSGFDNLAPGFANELRTVSITAASARILQSVCAGNTQDPLTKTLLQAANAHPFQRIAVRDMDQNIFALPTSGHIVGLHRLWLEAWKSAASRHAGDAFCKNQIRGAISSVEVNQSQRRVLVRAESVDKTSSHAVDAALVIGCDGAKSLVRESMHGQTLRVDHAQKAFVFCVEVNEKATVENSHKMCTCYQNFLRDGSIIALLPTSASTANIVLSASHALGERFVSLQKTAEERGPEATNKDYIAILNTLLHENAPHDIPVITRLLPDTTPFFQSKVVASFPLALNVALQPHAQGRIVVGDAARSIHPLAGQGLNLGIADSAVLFDCICEVLTSGGDISQDVGKLYNRRMKMHSWPMIASTEVSKRLFASENYWVKAFRKHGMSHVNNSSFLQKVFASYASGDFISASLAK